MKSHMKRTTITARRLLTASGQVDYPLLTIEEGRVASVEALSAEEVLHWPATHRFPEAALAPSFLDVHIHGSAGHDVMEGTAEAVDAVSAFLAQRGVGAYVPTTVTSPRDETLRSLAGLARQIDRYATGTSSHATPLEIPRATPLGIHLEGPFLSTAKRGVHIAALLEAPSIPLFERMWQASEGRIVLLTIAPELPGSLELIAHASALGVRCSLGHSNATWEECRASMAAGAISATHTFNAMSGLDHRAPGLAAFVLDEPSLYAEIISDGFHVDPVMVRLYLKCKGEDRVILVTDGISATGMPDGRYKLGSMAVDVREGRCTAGGAIAGSVLTLDKGVENFMAYTGAALRTAVNAASRNPARLLGVEDAWGSLETGRSADIAVLSPKGEIITTFLHGMCVADEAGVPT